MRQKALARDVGLQQVQMQTNKHTDDEADAAAAFEKDMSSLEAQQDIYFVLFAAILNVSVLRSVQPLVAKKGLMILLGTNSMLAGRLAGGANGVVPAGEAEEKLLHLCSSIIQNISLHPQNRTRLYKAELAGGAALEKLIENATERMADEPSLSWESSISCTLFPNSSVGGGAEVARSSGVQLPAIKSAGGANPSAQASRNMFGKKTAANKHLRITPNGHIINQPVSETSIAGVVRPKVSFPAIVETRDDAAYLNMRGVTSPGHGRPVVQAYVSPGGDQDDGGDGGEGEGAEGSPMTPGGNDEFATGGGDGDFADNVGGDSRSRFLNWMDNTFLAEEREAASQAAAAEALNMQKSYRRVMWDENGDWLEAEVETSKSLHRWAPQHITFFSLEAALLLYPLVSCFSRCCLETGCFVARPSTCGWTRLRRGLGTGSGDGSPRFRSTIRPTPRSRSCGPLRSC